MEPTLASRLKGDYKTGKRINMKKVIPYIASHYQKDKIWPRHTRPNKRDYQVVIVVDDSCSMSEFHCGDIVVEALVMMVSSLTFKQGNTIADEPMVDLLKYVNNILDAVVVNLRLPSRQNPLQQLVLIISDGRFHEKTHSPFSFYIVLRDIEALPRTLADLLRQWFELMQSSRD
ncbi:Midasin [Camellia lanceoleosa]|uniref:Midasin n=1 Tax=Camellia lanceoleosa TaxID=1840588 RepID=A0ACC0FA32_9ERIC|nr:Midasin [Camellia lanceoleosa]